MVSRNNNSPTAGGEPLPDRIANRMKPASAADLAPAGKAAAEKAASEVAKDASGWFGIARTEGMGAAVKNNLGGAAWKSAPVKTAFKAGTIAVGLGAMGDAVFRSETMGADGKMEKRGALGRWTEFVLGGAAAGAMALHGGRK
jgi:hypothetical protein